VADALMPDPSLIVGAHLRTHPLVKRRVGTRSSESLNATLPAIRYSCTTNRRTGPEEWRARMQVECWADLKGEKAAMDTARDVVASLEDLPGARATAEVISADVTNSFPAPDPDTKRPRQIVLVDLLLYALDPVEAP